MAILSALKTMADRMIAQEGQSCTVYFVEQNDDDYDPTVGDATPTVTAVASNMIALDFALVSNGAMTYGNTLLEHSDREVYLSHAVGFPRVPSPAGDYIIDSQGNKWRIAVVKTNNPTGVPSAEIMYKILCKK